MLTLRDLVHIYRNKTNMKFIIYTYPYFTAWSLTCQSVGFKLSAESRVKKPVGTKLEWRQIMKLGRALVNSCECTQLLLFSFFQGRLVLITFKEKRRRESPLWLSRLQTQLGSMRMQVWSLVSLRGSRIWRCRELWGRSQTWLRSCIAVAVE